MIKESSRYFDPYCWQSMSHIYCLWKCRSHFFNKYYIDVFNFNKCYHGSNSFYFYYILFFKKNQMTLNNFNSDFFSKFCYACKMYGKFLVIWKPPNNDPLPYALFIKKQSLPQKYWDLLLVLTGTFFSHYKKKMIKDI